jgi:hypothetical protein
VSAKKQKFFGFFSKKNCLPYLVLPFQHIIEQFKAIASPRNAGSGGAAPAEVRIFMPGSTG